MMIGLERTYDSDERVDNRQTSVVGWALKGTTYGVKQF